MELPDKEIKLPGVGELCAFKGVQAKMGGCLEEAQLMACWARRLDQKATSVLPHCIFQLYGCQDAVTGASQTACLKPQKRAVSHSPCLEVLNQGVRQAGYPGGCEEGMSSRPSPWIID